MKGLLLYSLALLYALPIPADPPLSLEETVRLTREQSPKIRAARFEAQAAQTQTDREKPVARPTLTVQAQGTLQGPRVTFPRGSVSDATVLPERFGKIELNLEQTLYRPGLSAARERYGAQSRANQWEQRRAENEAIREARRAFFDLLTAREMAEVAREGEKLARQHLEQTKHMLESGTAPERDLLAAEADLAEAEQGALKAENGIALARGNLNRILGRDPLSPLEIAPPTALPMVPDSPHAALERAMALRPEIHLLEQNLRAARAGISLARTQTAPAFSARATAATQTPTAFTDSNYFAASLVMTWNLLDGGKARADVQEARARLQQLESLGEEARLGIRLEVEKAWREMREAQSRIETAQRQVASAEKALEISLLRYELRQAIHLEVSGARLTLLRARANRAQAVFDLHIAAVELRYATGEDVTPSALNSAEEKRER
jgi:outer membrane protein TolC